MSLKKQTISGVKWTTISTVLNNILQLIQLAILARLLNPKDFGLMAIVMVVLGFVSGFADLGISNALIHRQNITKNELSSLYWLNIVSGIAMCIVTSAISPLISKFYKEPELTKLIILISFTFIIQSFSQQFSMLLQKELRFKELARIEMINKLFSFIVSGCLAYVGYGVYSLVYGSLAASLVMTLQFLPIGLREYRPSLRFKIDDIRSFFSFGAYQMGERTVNYFNYQIDTLLIGKLLGMQALGIYNVAKQIVMRPAMVFNPIVTRVTFPAMAKVQDNVPALKNAYLKTIRYLSSVNFPVYAFIFVFAYDIVLFMFGAKWLDAVIIIQILSVWAAWRSTGNPIGSLLLARGRADLGFWWNLGLFFYVPIAVWIFSRWGLVGVAIGLNFIIATLAFPGWKILVKPLCGAGFLEYNKEILKPAGIAILTGLAGYLSTFWLNLYPIIKIGIGVFVGFLLTFYMYYKFNRDFLETLMEMRK